MQGGTPEAERGVLEVRRSECRGGPTWQMGLFHQPARDTMREPTTITPDLIAQHGITPEEYQRILAILARAPNFTELGHLLRHVVGALQLQELPRPPEDASHRGSVHSPGAGGERRGGGHRGRPRHRLQDGEPQPPLVHRAPPGCGHGRGRHHPGHLHHGGAADRPPGPAALRPAHGREEPLPGRWRRGGDRGVRERRGRSDGGGRAVCP